MSIIGKLSESEIEERNKHYAQFIENWDEVKKGMEKAITNMPNSIGGLVKDSLIPTKGLADLINNSNPNNQL